MTVPEHIVFQQKHCIYCNKLLLPRCGEPVIKFGGCCVGFIEGKNKYIVPRQGHIFCWEKYKHKKPELLSKLPIRKRGAP